MSRMTVRFTVCLQNSQRIGGDDEHMTSVIFFNIAVDGTPIQSEFRSVVKQTIGANFASSPLEVSRPEGYKGPFNHQAFSQYAERYYRESFGPDAIAGPRFGPGVVASENIVARTVFAEFDVSSESGSW